MSFLIDPPLLWAGGRAYARRTPAAPDRGRDAVVIAATMAVFWGVSVSVSEPGLNAPHLARLPGHVRARDWMLNSGVLRLDAERAGPPTHALSAAIFATGPAWLWLGVRRGRSGA
jgi:hypothetical protein